MASDAAAGARELPLLELTEVSVSYSGGAVRALENVDLRVYRGQIVVLIGVNGAGKTTALSTISGLLPFTGGSLDTGAVLFEGQDLKSRTASARVQRGISMVMEGRRTFPDLTVEENLTAGGFTRTLAEAKESRDRVYGMFPILAERRKQLAGLMSGGEQQMLAIGRALMQRPTLLMLDEPSLGLAPLIVEQIKDYIVEINAEGTSVLLIEQNAAMALSIADYAYVLDGKSVARQGTGADLLADPVVQELYLGVAGEGRRSFRGAYEERKRGRIR
ncbi:ABC transporter ATP-binding protein [Microbacterium lushaniae]|nr:ABC transporter ATP-binding protein [Microbacterium lushaniae]KAA9158011.1 ABC transporter ATP-binding protein [Microbacterium lushaniae]